MERKRGTALILSIALIISIIGLGIAFAAFSQNLTINGSATVTASTWDIHYATTDGGSAPGSSGTTITPSATNTQSGIPSTATSTKGTLKATDFTWAGTFKTPGDRLSYTFYICNGGSYNAKVSSINTPNITCTKGGASETTICGKISYGVYKSSTQSNANRVAVNDTLNAGTCTQVWVIATLGDDITAAQLPDANITVTPTTITIGYTQN